MNDPFKILGLEPGASEEEIKKAYKKMALEHHPDRHPGDKEAEERFKEISGAYETLKKNNWKQESFGGNYGFNGFSSVNIDINELFNQAFGGGGYGPNPFGRGRKVGRVKTGRLYISLEEAYHGCTKKVNVNDVINCETCKGRGYKLTDQKCVACDGRGQMRNAQGSISMIVTCQACKGFGRSIASMCMDCNGKGKKSRNQEVTINIPPGTHHGAKVNPSNDLQVQVLYSQHKEYKIVPNSLNIVSDKEIDMFTALLGGSISVNTLGGVKKVKIPAGCQPETILRIKQAGMKIKHSVGDHMLNIKVKLPTELTEEQKELLQTIQKQLEENKNGKS